MGLWTALIILLGIAGFYIFLSIYLLFHLVSRHVLARLQPAASEVNSKSLAASHSSLLTH